MRSGTTGVRIAAGIAALCLASAAAPDETASPAIPDADVRKLMNYGVALARQILGDHPAFHPFAFPSENIF